MKRRIPLTLLILITAMLQALQTHAEEAVDAVAVQVTGSNVSLVKTLYKDQPPEVDAVFGALNVLKVKEVLDTEGNVIEGFAEKLLHYLPVAAASDLLGNETVGKTVVVQGVLHKEALVLDVKDYEVQEPGEGGDGDEFDWNTWYETDITSPSQAQVI